MNNKSSFTLLEILIVIGLLVLIALAIIVLLNPMQQINRSRDAQRKHDLDTMRKAFEDYYNDKSCYPKLTDVCYAGTDKLYPVTTNPCYICGKELTPDAIKPYLDPLPCDPLHPQKDYAYQVDSANLSCPSWFRLYANFDITNDPDSVNLGCGEGGCGVAPNYGYDWGVSSPNTLLNKTPAFSCYTTNSKCESCGSSYQNCQSDQTCLQIYGSKTICCQRLPKPQNC